MSCSAHAARPTVTMPRSAFDDDGRILAIRDQKDLGAYMPVGIGTPVNTAVHLLGPYHVPNYECSITIVATNKAPNAPYRGAGSARGGRS